MLITNQNIEEIQKICKKLNVKRLYLFGSSITENFNSNSDIDLLVDFDETQPEKYYDCYYNLKVFLIKYFDRRIDLLELRALKNPYLIEEINKTKILVYGKEN